MPVAERTASVVWEGTLLEGHGHLDAESSGVLKDVGVTWASRTERPDGHTSPEELLAAAHAACYAMALSSTLAKRDTPAEELHVTATCTFDRVGDAFRVTAMDLVVKGKVPGIDQAAFEDAARTGEQGCPVSNALRGNVEIRLRAELEG